MRPSRARFHRSIHGSHSTSSSQIRQSLFQRLVARQWIATREQFGSFRIIDCVQRSQLGNVSFKWSLWFIMIWISAWSLSQIYPGQACNELPLLYDTVWLHSFPLLSWEELNLKMLSRSFTVVLLLRITFLYAVSANMDVSTLALPA